MKLYTAAIILAGGAGERSEQEMPKQFVKIAGKRVVEFTIEPFQRCPEIDDIVVVCHKNYRELLLNLVKKNGFSKVSAVVIGGDTRQESSYIGLQACNPKTTHVLIHDAARPFVTEEIIRRIISKFGHYNAIDTVINTADTIVRVNKATDLISDIPERASLKRGQTPQGFEFTLIRRAHELALQQGLCNAPDDCSLIMHFKLDKILTVPGDEVNIKITYPLDIYIADRIFQLRRGFVAVRTPREIRSRIKGHVAVVFGGKSGIGSTTAELFKKMGAHAYPFGREADVRNYHVLRETLENVRRRHGRIDYVVNCAGLLRLALIEHTSPEVIQEILETNLLGSIVVVKAAIPFLKESKGHIVLFTSSSYTRGREGYTPYSASKAGVVNFVQGVSEELEIYGIRINVINPERTQTPMRLKNFGKEEPSLLLQPRTVAAKLFSLLDTNLTGQVIDVRKEEEPEILEGLGWTSVS